MDVGVAAVTVLGFLLLVVTAIPAMFGLAALLSKPTPPRHRACGHDRLAQAPDTDDRCWLCRHGVLGRLMGVPLHTLHVHM